MSPPIAGPIIPELPGIEDLRAIGRGGFATVYRGWQPAFHRPVAVKILDSGPGVPGLSRFDKELRALGSLSGHPHVVPVYDAGTIDGRPYLVMPFLSGGSLEERLRSGGPLPAEEAIRLGAAIADALTAAHSLGMLHRDIKPSNILASAYGDPQLADFGIARFTDSTTTNGTLTATVSYAAPEVLAGALATPGSDIYSLAATLYTALRGTPPFAAKDGESLLALAVRAMIDAPADLRDAGVSPALAAVIAKAMSKDPAHRYRSAAELRDALESVRPDGPTDETARAAPVAPPILEAQAPPSAAAVVVDAQAPDPVEPPNTEVETRPDRVEPPITLVEPRQEPARAPLPPVHLNEGAPLGARRHPMRAIGAIIALLALCGLAVVVLTRHHAAPTPASRPPTTSASAAAAPATAAPSSATSSPASRANAGASPPSGDSAAIITQLVNSYYALVDQHRLAESFPWLSPAYQQRIGFAYYQQFWNSIARIEVVNVTPDNNSAVVTLHYVQTNGNASTEKAAITFTHDATGRLLIDTYRSV